MEMKFRKQGEYASCQLDAAINARIFLRGEDIDDKMFEELVDLTGCRHGSCTHEINKAYPILNLEYVDMDKRLNKLKWIKNNLPVEISYIDKKRGLHSALVIKVEDNILSLINGSLKKMKWESIKLLPQTYNQRFRSFVNEENGISPKS